MFDRIREWLAMRKYKKVRIIEKGKRKESIVVTELLRHPSLDNIFEFVCNHIEYRSEKKDFWKLPSETLRDGYGDCEDGAILLATLFRLAVPKKEWWQIFVYIYEKPAHAVVVIGDTVYDWAKKSKRTLQDIKDWRFWYCFNFRNSYTTQENYERWRKH